MAVSYFGLLMVCACSHADMVQHMYAKYINNWNLGAMPWKPPALPADSRMVSHRSKNFSSAGTEASVRLSMLFTGHPKPDPNATAAGCVLSCMARSPHAGLPKDLLLVLHLTWHANA